MILAGDVQNYRTHGHLRWQVDSSKLLVALLDTAVAKSRTLPPNLLPLHWLLPKPQLAGWIDAAARGCRKRMEPVPSVDAVAESLAADDSSVYLRFWISVV
jgi:hypothetical protein